MELKKYKLGELGKVITGKTPKTSKKENFDNGVIPFYTPEDIARGIGITGKNERFITEIGLSEIKNNSLEDESVLVGCIGSDMGNVAYTNHRCAMNQQINAITSFKDYICPLYVYYYLSTKKQEFRKIAGATTTPILPKSVFCNYIILLPKYHIQRKIASVLYNIDRKIEINRAINQNLEAMAKQLYDYWFVQFDFPNKDGKPYKSSGGKMVWNKKLKRKIPASWENKNIEDIADVYNGATPSTINEQNYGGDIVWITPKDLSDQNQKFVYQGERNISQAGYNSCSTHLLPPNTILMSSRAPIGLLSIAKTELCTNQGFKSFVPKAENISTYLYYYLNIHIKQIEQLGTGTTFKEVSREDVLKFPILKPSDAILDLWEKQVSALNNKQFVIQKEKEFLTKQRDEILPLLMNGQVSVNSDLSDD